MGEFPAGCQSINGDATQSVAPPKSGFLVCGNHLFGELV
jgi:hypothetical protein